ncbi:hypothetical protein KAFR_0I02600 [Kazachstania africana CBS 2517]|uniref:ubiquitinyl hydrolase 1 n=1 Tax=Kazachstania africana (strain ATCC 22294 / BCRC 22015 / CBS 2517 / CECT 1963 / NBRC 1671 / NRRL Y-8276) TaxID=1071382 RepID=H2B089_KAZAF|nr:hypothetical protein KAFR_0I02600 [Kazachstania africana CBS 2517]CCF60039.1 hypothetical protein KAFR_0I02600 [Kazachstania africana CBS 2517]
MNSIVYGDIKDETVHLNKSLDTILPLFPEQESDIDGSFTWHIDNWYNLSESKYVSPRFRIGDFEWDVLLFPNGNRNKGLAIYLEPHPVGVPNEDEDWYCCAQFAIVLSRPGHDGEIHMINKSHHRFNANDTDWGFANFIDLDHLKQPFKGKSFALLNEGKLNISVYVRILKDPTGVLWHNFLNYNSKKVTGYVGFKNQGATCYLNSLLQSYFFTKYFRRLVYQIPTENDSPNNSVPLALQRAFYQLQVSDEPLDTLELTRSFGWDSGDAFTQHDVQELNRILMDRLENKMKGTPVEDKLNEIFVGRMKSYIKCINVDYESSRVEEFWDLQMNVKNLKDLKSSFENYIEIELMNGENQYAAQDYGLQDAEKGVIFESFPPVLHLQLKRFEYDFNYDQLIKVNDRYEFPDSIDVSSYIDKMGTEDTEMPPCIYKLHGVLVHAGDISTGHYYAMIKPSTEDQWYRFDDEKVWKVTKTQVFDENFGLDRIPDDEVRLMSREQYQNYLLARHTSAYMLVYIREDQEADLLQPVTENDVPKHVIERVQKEKTEKELREKEIREAHLYLKVFIHTIKNFLNFEGFDLTPNDAFKHTYQDLNDGKEKPLMLKVARTMMVSDLYRQIKKELNLSVERDIRYWRMSFRQNNTLRLKDPIVPSKESLTLEETLKKQNEESISSIDLFVEEPYLDLNFLNGLKEKGKLTLTENAITESLVDDLRNNLYQYIEEKDTPRVFNQETHNLIFLKKFDIKKQKLTGLAYCAVDQLEQVSTLLTTVANFIGVDTESLSFSEEINPGNVVKVPKEQQICTCELTSGDILSFQLPSGSTEISSEIFPFYDSIEAYYHYLEHRVKLRFSNAELSANLGMNIANESDEGKNLGAEHFELWVSAYISYKDLSILVAKHVNIKPELLKLFAIYTNGRYVMKSKSVLNDYLLKDYNCDMIPPFEYEVLSMPLEEFEHLRSVKFYWLKNSYIHYQCFEFEVPATFTMGQFLNKIQDKVGFTDEEESKILLWTNHNFQFQGILTPETSFKQISKSYLIFGRVLGEESELFKKFDEEISSEENSEADDDISMSPSPAPDTYKADASDSFEDDETKKIGDSKKAEEEGRLVIVQQYFKEIENRHGISFLFNLIPDEPFTKTRERLHAKFGLGQKEFSKIKLGILFTMGQNRTFKSLSHYSDNELEKVILYKIMSNLDYIFMDHPDRLRSHNTHDRPMVIKN